MLDSNPNNLQGKERNHPQKTSTAIGHMKGFIHPHMKGFTLAIIWQNYKGKEIGTAGSKERMRSISTT